MRGELPLDGDDALERPLAEPSALDWTLSLPALSLAWLAGAAALILAAALRLPELNRWALSAREADIALAARDLVNGNDYPANLLGAPAVVEWTALFIFSGASVDSVARIATAVLGIAAVALILALGRWLGQWTALAAGLLAALSPTLIVAGRRIDAGGLLIVFSLLLLLALLRARELPGLFWPGVAGIAAGALLLSGPLGLPALLLAGLGFYLIAQPHELPERDGLIAAGLGFLGTVVLLGTVFLTRPRALPESLAESFRLLWNEHIREFGRRYYMPLFDLILNEPLLLVLAVVALVAGWAAPRTRALALWTLAAFLFASLFNGSEPAAYALVALPLVLLAGQGLVTVVERVARLDGRGRLAVGYGLAIVLLAFAFLSLAGLVTGPAQRSTSDTIARFVLVVGIAIIPLGLGLALLGRRLSGVRLFLLLTTVVVVLGATTVRSAVLSVTERPGEPGDPLAAGVSGADIPLLVDVLGKISRDLTLQERDARDPTGGHGLRIAIDERIEQPFAWYFRDYYNAVVFDPERETPPSDTQVLLLDDSRDAAALAPGMTGQFYLYDYGTPPLFESPDWGNIAAGAFNLNGWRRFGDLLFNRALTQPAEPRWFQLYAAPAVAERLFAASGPYNLDDRAGAGRAEGQFIQPRGVAIDAAGTIYVVDSGNLRVQRFGPSGEFELSWGSEGGAPGEFGLFAGDVPSGPGGIAIGSDGNIYVADTWNHRIQAFTPDGEYLRAWGSFFDAADDPNLAAEQPGAFYGPRGVAAHDGLLYITDTGNERVQVFTEEGEFVRAFGAIGSELGQLLEPVGITVTADGVVLVADSHNARIARFTLEGEPLEPWPVLGWDGLRFFEPYLAVGLDGLVYATSSAFGQVLVLAADGSELGPLFNGELSRPYGIAITPDGTQALVSDGVANAVIRTDARPLEP